MSIVENLRRVQDQIAATGRPVQLIAVSKIQPVDSIREAATAGQHAFGENYVQELVNKAEALADLQLNWHFIGHLQRNKVNMLLPHISTIHSIDSVRLAEAIAGRARRSISGFVEVNIAGEASKAGIAGDQLPELLRICSEFQNLEIKGLMCIPPPTHDHEAQKKYFTEVASLQQRANTEGWYRHPLTDLSMGMSHDFMTAIECGATMVRIGTAIFGERPSPVHITQA